MPAAAVQHRCVSLKWAVRESQLTVQSFVTSETAGSIQSAHSLSRVISRVLGRLHQVHLLRRNLKRTVPHEERVFLLLWLLAFPHWWGKCCLWTVKLCSRLQTACFFNLQTFPLLETVLWRITHQKWNKPKKKKRERESSASAGSQRGTLQRCREVSDMTYCYLTGPCKAEPCMSTRWPNVIVCVRGRGARLSTVKYLKYTTSIINKNKVLGG